jgi:hypothetical protein
MNVNIVTTLKTPLRSNIAKVDIPTSSRTTGGKKSSVKQLLNSLGVSSEEVGSYDRNQFKHWITSNKCDTRQWVLIRQTLRGKQFGCSIVRGKWYSAYDAATTMNSSTFDVDHMVPLSEAHKSGAYAWSANRRMNYANDLTYKPALIAVTASSNRSKGDKDPAKWMPPLKSDWCDYLKNWVGVKYRWSLTVDLKEKTFIATNIKPACGNKTKMAIPPSATSLG